MQTVVAIAAAEISTTSMRKKQTDEEEITMPASMKQISLTCSIPCDDMTTNFPSPSQQTAGQYIAVR